MVVARAAEMEGDAQDAIGKAMELLRAKQSDVNEEVDKVLASYTASLLPHDLETLRRKATSKVYTAGATVVKAVAIEAPRAIAQAAVVVAKLQLSRAAEHWLIEAVTKAVAEGEQVEKAVRSSVARHAELVEEVKTAFAAAELGDHEDLDRVVMTVLSEDTTVDMEVQKVKEEQGDKQKQTVWDTAGNKQSRLVKAEQLAFCPVKAEELALRPVRDTAATVHSASYTLAHA
jgi:hypothetical protein